VIKTSISITLSFLALGLGIATVFIVSENRARSADLDRWQRWSEIFERQNEAARAALEKHEWELLYPSSDALGLDPDAPADGTGGMTP
jgi:hypothetical protein